MHFDLKSISEESVPEAFAKVERYRLLNVRIRCHIFQVGRSQVLALICRPAPHGAVDGLCHGRREQECFDGISDCGRPSCLVLLPTDAPWGGGGLQSDHVRANAKALPKAAQGIGGGMGFVALVR